MAAYFDGKEVDRLPAMPMIDSVGPKLIGEKNRFKRQPELSWETLRTHLRL